MSSISPRCCVCGVTATQRCSSCSPYGLDLFFCTREHQKLIWPIHKLVCGERAAPFRWPDLSKEEIAFLRKIEDFPLEGFGCDPQGRPYNSLGDLLRRANPLGSLEAVIHKLVTEPDHPDIFWLSRQLRTLRGAQLLYLTETNSLSSPSSSSSSTLLPPPIPLPLLFAGQYLQLMSLCARKVYKRAMRHEDLSWQVDTRLHHLLLILAIAKEKRMPQEGKVVTEEAEKFYKDALANLVHYVRVDLPKMDKEAARLLRELPDLVKDL